METCKENQEQQNPHCLILPYPAQGHINPMLQFSKRLHNKGITITFILTKHLAKTVSLSSSDAVSLETISDGYDDGNIPTDSDAEIRAYYDRFKEVGSKTLKETLERLSGLGRPVNCIVYDPVFTWALEVAKELGIVGAAFFTQSCSVLQIYYQVYKGDLKLPLSGDEVLVPGLTRLRPEELPSFLYVHGSYLPILEMILGQFQALDEADWLFYNTFYELEQEVIDDMAKTAPVKAIGPTIPSMYLDKRLCDDREYGLSLFKPVTAVCMDWLDKQQPDSVIYVSFGSMAQLGEAQMEELAWGLRLSNKHFLWVVRSSEESKLPKGFAEEASDKGLIVSWCPQLEVLAHRAASCFVAHCGWNSTLEALSLGVPMVGIPQWSDQGTNAKFVMDAWRMGVRADTGENGIVSRETIASCIRDVMEGERGEEMKKNAVKWKEFAREAMDEGGSSDRNIEEFVSALFSKSSQMVS